MKKEFDSGNPTVNILYDVLISLILIKRIYLVDLKHLKKLILLDI